jgi:hypothetical protein
MIKLLPCLLILTSASCLAASSENNDRLREALKRYPAADTDNDGILTMQEGLAYRAKMRGGAGKTSGKGARQAKARTSKQPQLLKATGASTEPGKEIRGLNGLYMGHSFFTPAARHLPTIIPDTNVVNHVTYSVMSGGQSGSPRMLWENEAKRTFGQKYLDKGDVDLMCLTYYSPADSSLEHYAKWFDYALKKNPDIMFMLAIPWGKELHKEDAKSLDKRENGVRLLYQGLVIELRKKYPQNKILFCPYGLAVHELARRILKDELPGVNYVLNPDKKARQQSKRTKGQLLNDELGHGGELVTHLNALIWLQTIYDVNVAKLKKQRVPGLPDVDLNEIAAKVYKKIPPFNAVYQTSPASSKY